MQPGTPRAVRFTAQHRNKCAHAYRTARTARTPERTELLRQGKITSVATGPHFGPPRTTAILSVHYCRVQRIRCTRRSEGYSLRANRYFVRSILQVTPTAVYLVVQFIPGPFFLRDDQELFAALLPVNLVSVALLRTIVIFESTFLFHIINGSMMILSRILVVSTPDDGVSR